MRKALIFILFFLPVLLHAATYYLSPNGNDTSGNGTIGAPWFTLNKAWTAVAAGDVIYMRGGTYAYSSTQILSGKNGTSNNRILITAYANEKPVVTKQIPFTYHSRNLTSLIFVSANYITVSKLELTGFIQQDIYLWMPICLSAANNCIIERMHIHHNGNGVRITGASNNNLILSCDIYDNYDPISSTPYDDCDGVNIDYVPAGNTNTIQGCRIYSNSDDGVDLWRNEGTIIVDNCWIWGNGYREDHSTVGGNGNAVKLGETQTSTGTVVQRILTRNLLFMNRMRAVDQNEGVVLCHVYNNTIWNNVMGIDLWNYNLAHIIRNNAVFGNATNYSSGNYSNSTRDHNSYHATWQPSGVVTDASDFLTTDTTGISGPRQANGDLPNLNFLKLSSTSRLINAGTNVGIPYVGSAPDLGAFEYMPPPKALTIAGNPLIFNNKLLIQ